MIRRPWLLSALLAVGCGRTSPTIVASTPPPDRFGAGAHISYGEGPERSLDFFEAGKGGPLVVFVHGGAWQGGGRGEYRGIMTELQRQGIASVSVDYRLSPGVQHPAHADDVAHALGWLAKNGAKMGFDPKRIFVVGHSAGAHIAATIATDPKLLALALPAGFVGLEGIYDVPNLAARWPSYPDWFLKKAFGAEGDWAAASPTRAKLVSKAPWLLVHSRADELVDPPQTDDFAQRLRDSGVAVEVLSPEGKSHDEVVKRLQEPGDEVAKAIVGFVRGHS